jgi:2-succinyl-5-enolpyruvyl-6-hydroxy-3-cyclohexene-1-carboxylate synthase
MTGSGPVNAGDVQAAFCSVLVDEWVRAGVTDAVASPGSRSTPLVIALDENRHIRVHVVLDERAAGFVALGLALASRRPAVVATTSGTAAVELHPAVTEAFHAGVPLIAATSDRPPELHQVGAPQTVEQEGVFAGAARWSAAPGVADLATSGSWRSVASRCVAEALAGSGPVHVNLAFREPLLGSARRVTAPEGRPNGAPWHALAAGTRSPAPGSVDRLLSYAGRRGLIVAGGGARLDPEAVVDAARRLGWVVMADPRSGCRIPHGPVVAAADALLRVPEIAGWRPDLVLRLGAPWASKVVNQWLAALPASVPQVLVDPDGRWLDPDRSASEVLRADPDALMSALGANVEQPAGRVGGRSPDEPGGETWPQRWEAAEAEAQAAFESELAAGAALDMSEPGVARAVLAGVPADGLLVTSSSMPVRDVEWYAAPRTGATVLANRGANGIDGVLATSIGAALASRQPTVAILGDLAFLYDAGSLLWAAGRDVALTVVVVDNNGGGIFSFLPQAAALESDRFERYWGTPHGIDPADVAAGYGVDVVVAEDRGALDAAVAGAAKPGVRVVVVRSDRTANVAAHDRLHQAVSDRIADRRR